MKRSRESGDEPAVLGTGSESLDSVASHKPKIIEIDPAGEPATTPPTNMICLLHKEKAVFTSYAEYESHYGKAHVNRCIECRKNFPSPHLLGVHIEDCHDPLVSVKRERGEHTYSCFVEDCERKCGTPEKRRRHLIDKHHYPKNFFFAVTLHGIEGRRSLLEDHHARRARRSSSLTGSITSRDADDGEASQGADASTSSRKGPARAEGEPASPDQMDHLASAMSELNVLPQSIRFGRGGRAGFARR